MHDVKKAGATRPGIVSWPRRSLPFVVVGGGMVIAGGLVSAVQSAAPFAHGAWLAAYLVLVGGVAQIVLGVGQESLGRDPVGPAGIRWRLALWNAGALVVPAGVLLDAPGVVVLGSVALLSALGLFAAAVRPPAPAGRRWAPAYAALLAVLVLSVFVGCALAWAEPARAGTLLPERGGSPNADNIASLYAVVLVVAAIVFVGVVVALVFSLVRYGHRRRPVAQQIHGNTRLEIGWTVAASVLIVVLAVFALSRFGGIDDPAPSVVSPAVAATVGATDGGHGPLRIGVVGRQYVWMYKYPNGATSYGEMVAPVGVTVELDIVSVDVAHSWWIPKLGGKFDALPGYVNHTWFRLERPGVYRGQCAELCGRNHADMLAQVRGVSPAAYRRWVTARQRQLVDATAAVARERARSSSTASQGAP